MTLDRWSSRVRRRWVLPLLASVPVAAVVIGLGACLPVPLGDPEKSAVDPRLAGVWSDGLHEDGGTCLVSIPYDARTLLVHAVELKRAGGGDEGAQWSVRCKSHYKAWLTPIGEATFVTLAPLYPPGVDKAPIYVIARIAIPEGGDKVLAHGLDPEFPPLKEACEQADARDRVQKVVRAHLDDEKMYGKDFDVAYDRVTDPGVLRAIARAFSDD